MTELTCAEVVELVTDYLDGVLDAETESRFLAHTAECDGCERYLEQFRETIRLAGSLTPEAIDPVTRDRLLAAFRGWSRSGPAM